MHHLEGILKMNRRRLLIFKGLSYTFLSNVISLGISVVLTLIIPKVVGVESYGYWQLYLFYASYIGFLHLGWNDGLYLKYGGQKYADLDHSLIGGEFYLQLAFQVLISGLIFICSTIIPMDENKRYICRMLAIAIPLTNAKCMLSYILQASNRIIEYAKVTILDRMMLLVLILLVFSINKNYQMVIWADVSGRLISFILAMLYCKEIIVLPKRVNKRVLRDSFDNIGIGCKLMLANILSTLILGIIRGGIESGWPIETFGEVSLTLNLSHLILTFVNSVGVVIYPILKQASKELVNSSFVSINECITFFLLAILIIYPILEALMLYWLPNYSASIEYMSILLPVCVFESKTSLLINTYYKIFRYEKKLLLINLFCFLVSLLGTYICVQLHNLRLIVTLILVVLMLRTIIAEYILGRELCLKLNFIISCECALCMLFVVCHCVFNVWNAGAIYLIGILLYFGFRHKKLQECSRYILNV